MKTIDRHNIEEMLFLYMEGLLEREERRQVEEYVASHSEAGELMQLYDPQLTLPKELPLTGKEGRPLSYPGKDALYSHAMAAAQEPDHKQETPVVPLRTSRAASLRRTLSAAACAAVILFLGIEVVLHQGNPSLNSGPAIADARHNRQQQGSTPALSHAIAEAEKQQSLHHEARPQPATRPAAQANTGRPDHNLAELQAIAATLQSTRHETPARNEGEILLGYDYDIEDISALLAEYQSEEPQQNSPDLPGEVIVVDDLIVYIDSLSPAERAWSSLETSSPQLAALRQQWESRPQSDSTLVAQNEDNILQRIAQRMGLKRKTSIKTEFNNLGEYLAQVDNLKQTSLKWIADGADTLSQRFTAFTKNTLQDERPAARRKP